ncbi:MAG: folate-binding protein [Actinobacteria bacterium]|nr:folate-binding protein [Actinomycetota bacterium]
MTSPRRGRPDKGAVWHCGEVAKEQRALADGKAWADLSHRTVVAVSGEERLAYLHAVTTQHVENLQPGVWKDGLILDAQGHIAHQFILVDDGTTTFLQVDSERAQLLISYLTKMKFMMKVDVRDASSEFVILRAPGKTDDIGGPYALVPVSEKKETIDAFNQANLQVGMWAIEAERVASGRARIGLETDHKSIPNELGLLNGAVHMKKGCYPGQETVAKVFNLGHPPRRLVLLHLDGSDVKIPAHGSPVFNGETEVGFVGTVARHYELGTIALAIIKRTVPANATLHVEGIPASQEILVPVE